MKSLLCFLALIPITVNGQPATQNTEVQLPALQTPDRWIPHHGRPDIKPMHVAIADMHPGGSIPLASARPRLRAEDTLITIEFLEPLGYYLLPSDYVYLDERSLTPYNDTNDWIATYTTVYQLQRGAPFIFSGGRPGEILYVIDGVQVARR